MFRGCWACGTLVRDVLYCPECMVNICAESSCQDMHATVHADVLWNKRLDERTQHLPYVEHWTLGETHVPNMRRV